MNTSGSETQSEESAPGLERLKFELDKSSAEQDLLIRQADLRLRLREVVLKEADFRRTRWRDPLVLAIAGAVLT